MGKSVDERGELPLGIGGGGGWVGTANKEGTFPGADDGKWGAAVNPRRGDTRPHIGSKIGGRKERGLEVGDDS